MSTNETAQRISSERQRLGLTVAQFAVLLGISEDQQASFEAGNTLPISYGQALLRAGADPQFVFGHSAEPTEARQDLLFGDGSFLGAVDLLRKSQQAVEAFVGEGASRDSPELVAALMNATLQDRFSVGAGNLEDFATAIAGAIESAGAQIAEALTQDPEA